MTQDRLQTMFSEAELEEYIREANSGGNYEHWKRDVTTTEQVRTIVTELLKHVHPKGRLLLALYWGSNHPIGSEEYTTAQQSFLKFVELIKSGVERVGGEAFSKSGFHWIMWMDKFSVEVT